MQASPESPDSMHASHEMVSVFYLPNFSTLCKIVSLTQWSRYTCIICINRYVVIAEQALMSWLRRQGICGSLPTHFGFSAMLSSKQTAIIEIYFYAAIEPRFGIVLSFERFVVQNAEYSDREHSVITVTQYFWMVTQGTHSSGTTDFFCHKSWKYFPLSCKYVWIRWITFLTHIPYQCVVEKLRSLKHKCVFCTKGKRHDWEIGQSFFQTSNYSWVIIWKEMKHRYSFMIFLFRIIKVLLFSLYDGYWAYNGCLMFGDTVCTRNCILERFRYT